MHGLTERVRFVLVETSHPGNIGGAARALKTMGFGQLTLVRPARFPDPQAQWRAAGAQDVLEAARVVDTLDDAIGDCQWVVGTSTRQRRIPWPLTELDELAAGVAALPDALEVAILFGREANGLSNDELMRCNQHLTIDANPEYPSLNLAMSVQVVSYALARAAATAPSRPAVEWDREPASQQALEGMLVHLERALGVSGYLQPDNPGQTMTRLRRLFLRTRLDETEVQMLRGIWKLLESPPRR